MTHYIERGNDTITIRGPQGAFRDEDFEVVKLFGEDYHDAPLSLRDAEAMVLLSPHTLRHVRAPLRTYLWQAPKYIRTFKSFRRGILATFHNIWWWCRRSYASIVHNVDLAAELERNLVSEFRQKGIPIPKGYPYESVDNR